MLGTLKVETFLSCVKLIRDGRSTTALDALGVSQQDWDLVTGDVVWSITDRPRVQNVLHGIRDGMALAIGESPFKVSAEYTAAIISVFVSPTNMERACSYMESTPSAWDLAHPKESMEQSPVSASQLMALCEMTYGNPLMGDARSAFEKRTNLALARPMPEPAVPTSGTPSKK